MNDFNEMVKALTVAYGLIWAYIKNKNCTNEEALELTKLSLEIEKYLKK